MFDYRTYPRKISRKSAENQPKISRKSVENGMRTTGTPQQHSTTTQGSTMIAKPRSEAAPDVPGRTSAHRAHHFRGSLGRFATGVAIVTFDGVTKRHGITVNSFTSVSMDPPLVLVSIARTTTAHDELAGRPFTVNILGAEQRQLAMHFDGRP